MLIDSTANNVKSSYGSINRFPFSFTSINHPGDYEKENIVFQVKEDIDSLHNYILIYFVESIETGGQDYERVRILTFDDIQLKRGVSLQIYTRSNEQKKSNKIDKSDQFITFYWGLSEPIWSVPLSSYELIHRDESIGGGLLRD